VVGRLQKLIAEKQDHLQKLDCKVARLQDDVHSNSASPAGTAEYVEKIKALENQVRPIGFDSQNILTWLV